MSKHAKSTDRPTHQLLSDCRRVVTIGLFYNILSTITFIYPIALSYAVPTYLPASHAESTRVTSLQNITKIEEGDVTV